MSPQLLLDPQLAPPASDPEETIQERFLRFHEENPEIYELLVRFAGEVLAAGHEHYSIDSLFHRIRWHVAVESRDRAPFKLNDHYTSRYARLLCADPRFSGMFCLRELRAE